MSKRNVCVVLVDRANYGRLKPVLKAIAADPELNLSILASGTMVLSRFGKATQVVQEDGFAIDGEIYMELEGGTPETMAKSIGIGITECCNEFRRLKPDIVLLIGDRYEALSAAIAAAYMNLCLVHLQGGEVSGSIDESARHAITKFAHYHYPATARSAEYVIRMGEDPATVLGVGCPSSDIAFNLPQDFDPAPINAMGSGGKLNFDAPFLLTLFHPTTTEFGGAKAEMQALLKALENLAMPTLLLWPNIDAGSDDISKAIRIFRNEKNPAWLHTITNLEPTEYLKVLSRAAVAVGNSSSFVRDAGYFGTPVTLIGNRQVGREHGPHVVPVRPTTPEIEAGIRAHLAHGRYEPITLYGDGNVSARIVEGLKTLKLYSQKRLHYIHE